MLLVKLLATFLLPIVSSLHLPIERNGKECFTVQVEPFHTTLSLTYSILNDEDATIHVQLTDQFRNAVIFYKNDAEGRYVHKVTNPGLYELCLSNTIQAVHTLFVGFSLHPEEPNRDVLSNADAGTIAHAQKVEDLVYDMNVDLDMVRDTLSYMKTKGGIHQTLSESTNQRVAWWTSGEMVVLIVLALWQIQYLRSIFEVKRFL